MKNILKRLFIVLPLYVLLILSMATIVIPIFYWIFTGRDIARFKDKIDEL